MLGSLRTTLLALLAAGVLTQASGVAAAASVDDKAGLFSKEAVEKAEKKIAQLKRDYRRDVVIETFAEAPDVDKASDKDKSRAYFSSWSQRRYDDRDVRGVYVLICKKPNWVAVRAGKKTEADANFNTTRREAVQEKF